MNTYVPFEWAVIIHEWETAPNHVTVKKFYDWEETSGIGWMVDEFFPSDSKANAYAHAKALAFHPVLSTGA